MSSSAALFGGSFDPPHLAHRALAEAALSQLALDRVVWMPAAQSPLKSGKTLASGADRVAMLELLTAGELRFVIDERELRRPGPSYTVDTLRELHAERPDTDWWLVIGQDQYAHFDAWHAWREILALAGLAVAARGGQVVRPAPGLAAFPHRLHVLALPELPHSATAARSESAAGRDISALVGLPVARYIDHHHLYRARA
jgi:nicotinate-nucleotide adenylyltransferase